MDNDFESCPILFYQIKVIQKLEAGDQKAANEFWHKLAQAYPETHGREFSNYTGDKCLFSMCLKKHEKVNNVFNLKQIELPKIKEEALLKLLTEAETPLHQEIIYEMIWNEVPETKNDLNKVAQLVSILRQKGGLNIRIRKSCYYIEKVQKKKAS